MKMLRILLPLRQRIKMNIFVDNMTSKKFFISSIAVFLFTGVNAQKFTLDLKAPQFHSGITYLTYYYGKNMNVVDSTAIDSNGSAKFQVETEPLPGVYSVVLPGKRISLDFLLDSTARVNCVIKDTSNIIQESEVTGSPANDLFQSYQRYVAKMSPLMERERDEYMASRTKADTLRHQENYQTLNRELNAYRENILKNHPESMLASLFKSMKEPEILHKKPITQKDSLENYQYYKQHYWDGITFRDPRIIRTPFFVPKLEKYFEQVTNQNPDSLIKEIDYTLLLARTSQPMYQFLMNWFTDEYFQPKFMGQDKVFVHLFEKYHSQGVSTWLSDKQHKAIADRAYMVMSNLIGDPAAPMVMTDANEKPASLYNLKAKFTIVCFWDPTCGHCQHELPVLDSIYQKKWKQEGVRIYSVLTNNDVKDQWKKFIVDHHIQEWTNVYESEQQRKSATTANKPSYQQLYDVIQTPTIYLLDNEKRIIVKKLTIEQMDDVITARLNADKTK